MRVEAFDVVPKRWSLSIRM